MICFDHGQAQREEKKTTKTKPKTNKKQNKKQQQLYDTKSQRYAA